MFAKTINLPLKTPLNSPQRAQQTFLGLELPIKPLIGPIALPIRVKKSLTDRQKWRYPSEFSWDDQDID